MRGPVKRRPSTRKGRQEAIRKSGMEFDIDLPVAESEQTDNFISTETEKNIQNRANNNVQETINVETKETDIFKAKKPVIVKKSLFDDDDDDDDIFNNIVSKPSTTIGKIIMIF